jgi:microcystin-dependent protein
MIDFPANPTNGQTYTSGGATWQWDGVKWVAVGGGPFLPLAGGSMGGPILAADPTAPTELTNKEYVDGRSSAAVPVGGIIVWPTAALPSDYLICNGGVYNITDAPKLFAVIGAAFGGNGTTTFAVPNLLDRTVVCAGNTWALAGSGGEINHTLAAAEMPVHAHGVSDPTHNHAIADPGHSHAIGDPGHGHGFPDPGHAHSFSITGSFGYGIGPTAVTPLVNVSSTGYGTAGSGTGRTIQAAGTGVYTGAVGTGIGNPIGARVTGIAIQNAGSGGAHNNMPPFLALYFCIRYV